jgi:hypothetical protein
MTRPFDITAGLLKNLNKDAPAEGDAPAEETPAPVEE